MNFVVISIIVFILIISSQLYRQPRSKLEEVALIRGLPVYRYRVNATTAEKINGEVEKYYNKTGLDASEKEGWNAKHLSNAFYKHARDDDLPTLSKELSICIKKLCKRHSLSPKLASLSADKDYPNDCDYWVNLYNVGHYQGRHCHINDGDDTPFYCYTYFSRYSHGIDGPLSFHLNLNDDEPITTPEIQQGDILIFGPTLEHSVEQQKKAGPRITVSGNIYHDLFRDVDDIHH